MFLTCMSNTYINRNHRFNMFIDTYGIHRFQIISKGRYSRCSDVVKLRVKSNPGNWHRFHFTPKVPKTCLFFRFVLTRFPRRLRSLFAIRRTLCAIRIFTAAQPSSPIEYSFRLCLYSCFETPSRNPTNLGKRTSYVFDQCEQRHESSVKSTEER